MADKKFYRIFSSAIFHASNSKRVAMFAKFLSLGKYTNLNNEVLQLYLVALYNLKSKNFNTNFQRIGVKPDEECVLL